MHSCRDEDEEEHDEVSEVEYFMGSLESFFI